MRCAPGCSCWRHRSYKCKPGCTCGRHERRKCPPGCACNRHVSAGKGGPGKPKAAEHKAKVGAALRGKPKSESHRRKISESLRARRAALPLAERFWRHVDVRGQDECWLWQGYVQANGYGRFMVGDREARLAHRVAYELAIGPVPARLVLDHVRARGCEHRHCVNPHHLEAVTMAENLRRGRSKPASNY
jgi:hypothetical protein